MLAPALPAAIYLRPSRRDGSSCLPAPPADAARRSPATVHACRQRGSRGCRVCVPLTLHTQAAVAAANADPEGGVVYLPAGTYLLDSTLVVERANVVLRGDGVSCGGVV